MKRAHMSKCQMRAMRQYLNKCIRDFKRFKPLDKLITVLSDCKRNHKQNLIYAWVTKLSLSLSLSLSLYLCLSVCLSVCLSLSLSLSLSLIWIACCAPITFLSPFPFWLELRVYYFSSFLRISCLPSNHWSICDVFCLLFYYTVLTLSIGTL